MFVKKYKILFYYFCVSLILSLSLSFYLNPKHLYYHVTNNLHHPQPQPALFHIDGDLSLDLNDTPTQYRGNVERHGYYNIDFDPTALKKSIIGNERLNLGIHGASKSTPMSLNNFKVVATDTGDIYVYKKDNIHWTLNLNQSDFGFHSTPILIGNHAIIGDYSGRIYFLDLENKNILAMNRWGNSIGASPLIDEHFLYINSETSQPNGFIAKVDLRDFKTIWISQKLGNHSHSSPVLFKNSIMFGDNTSSFRSLSTETGQVNWKIKVNGPIKSTPAVWQDNVYFTSWDGNLYSVNANNGKIQWSIPLSRVNQSSPSLNPEKKYGVINDQTGLIKFNLISGEIQNHYKFKFGSESRKASSVILNYKSKDYIVTPCHETQLCVFDNHLVLKKSYDFASGLSNQVGIGEDHLLVSTKEDEPLYILK